jgi:hypothetical protein
MSFQRVAGTLAILAGVDGLLYSVALAAEEPLLSALFLMLGGLFSSAALVALYRRLQGTEADLALWALVLVLIGAFGATVHGSYDLANEINPPEITDLEDTTLPPDQAEDLADLQDLANWPNQFDPRGVLTFGVSGLGLLGFAWLLAHHAAFPRNFSYLAYLLAVLLIIIYLGRLIALDTDNLLLAVPAVLAGVIVNPAWYIWLGVQLRREPGT